jgi:hypothetical protein
LSSERAIGTAADSTRGLDQIIQFSVSLVTAFLPLLLGRQMPA